MAKLKGVDDSLWQRANAEYKESEELKAARKASTEASAALQNSTSRRAEKAYKDLAGYGDFQYKADTDPLFQNAKSRAVREGRVAMEDTVGKATALTGGYANSYATTAGMGAYASYLAQTEDELADYYDMALDAHKAGEEALVNRFQAAKSLDDEEYERAYDYAKLTGDRYESDREYEYGAYRDSAQLAKELAAMQNADTLAAEEAAEDKRRYEAEAAESSRRFDEEMAQQAADRAAQNDRYYAGLAADAANNQAEREWKKEKYQSELEAEKEAAKAEVKDQRRLDEERYAARLQEYGEWIKSLDDRMGPTPDEVYARIISDAAANLTTGGYIEEDFLALIGTYVPQEWFDENYTVEYDSSGAIARLEYTPREKEDV